MKAKLTPSIVIFTIALMSSCLLNSCSSSYHTSSYPMIHKMKNEKFLCKINHDHKILNKKNSQATIQLKEVKANTIDLTQRKKVEILITNSILGKLENARIDQPDPRTNIASTNNEMIYSNNAFTNNYHTFNGYEHDDVKSFKYWKNHSTVEKSGNNGPAKSSNYHKSQSPVFGIISLAICLIALFVPFSISIVLGVVATVFGIMGLDKKLKGIAIAGLILGILLIVLGCTIFFLF